jgi:hypothetical protein
MQEGNRTSLSSRRRYYRTPKERRFVSSSNSCRGRMFRNLTHELKWRLRISDIQCFGIRDGETSMSTVDEIYPDASAWLQFITDNCSCVAGDLVTADVLRRVRLPLESKRHSWRVKRRVESTQQLEVSGFLYPLAALTARKVRLGSRWLVHCSGPMAILNVVVKRNILIPLSG